MTLKEPDIYERLGATGALVGILVALSKLGVFRRIRAWWNRPTEAELLRKLIADTSEQQAKVIHELSVSQNKLADTQDRQCTALDSIASTLSGIMDSMTIAEAMMQFLGDHEPTPLFRCELPSGRCVWTNVAMQKMFGRTREQMLGFGWVEGITSEQQPSVIRRWKDAAVNGEGFINIEFAIERDEGLVNVHAHADFIKDSKSDRRIVALGRVKRINPTTTPLQFAA